MKNSDIKVGYIYNVDFDPVRECEFNKKHLAVVLKKNNDGKTFIVLPFTSSKNGVGQNKILLGKIENLPKSLSSNDTYAVLNQIRTVNASRFISLKEGDDVIECKLDGTKFIELFNSAINQLTYSISPTNRLEIYNNLLNNEKVTQAKDIAYLIIKGRIPNNERKNKMKEISDLIKGIDYVLDEKYIEDGVKEIFEDSKVI